MSSAWLVANGRIKPGSTDSQGEYSPIRSTYPRHGLSHNGAMGHRLSRLRGACLVVVTFSMFITATSQTAKADAPPPTASSSTVPPTVPPTVQPTVPQPTTPPMPSPGPLPGPNATQTFNQQQTVNYAIPVGIASRSISQNVRVDSPAPTTFYATITNFSNDPAIPLWYSNGSLIPFGAGGYIGLQIDGTSSTPGPYTPTPKNFIFSLWGGTASQPGPGAKCLDWYDDPRSGFVTEGGYGMSCPMTATWLTGVPVTLTVAWDGAGTGYNRTPRYVVPPGEVPTQIVAGSWWKGTATQNGVTQTIARIFVPGTTQRINFTANFVEYFGPPGGRCENSAYHSDSTVFTPIFDGQFPAANRSEGGVIDTPCQTQVTWFDDGSARISIRPSATLSPVNISLPSITGFAASGETLTAQPGTWSNTPTYTYQWVRCDSSGTACAPIAGSTASTYKETSADIGSTLRVVVAASNAAGVGLATSGQTLKVGGVLEVPNGLVRFAGADALSPTSVRIKWSDTSTNEKGYLVYRVVGTTQTAVLGCSTTTPNLTQCVDTGLSSNTVYQYYVYSWSTSGSISPGTYLLTRTPSTAPAAPIATAAVATGLHDVRIDWKDMSTDETGFKVYRYQALNGSYSLVATTPANATSASFYDPAIDTHETYIYVVTSFNTGGETNDQAYVFTLARTDPTAVGPASPTYTSTNATGTTATINWTDNATTEAGYLVYRVEGSTQTLVAGCSVSTPGLKTCTDTGLTPGKYYQYHVYAWNNAGVGYPGTGTIVKTPDPLAAPTLTSANGFVNGPIRGIDLRWIDSSSDETSYEIFEYLGPAYRMVVELPANTTSFPLLALDASTTHTYVVVARRGPKASNSDGLWATTPA